MLDYMIDPPEPTAKELFIEDYVEKFMESDDKLAIVRDLYPDADENEFWDLVDEYATAEAERVYQEQEDEALEQKVDAQLDYLLSCGY